MVFAGAVDRTGTATAASTTAGDVVRLEPGVQIGDRQRSERAHAHDGSCRLMRAVVVALGKIGLPIAAQIARAGHHVVGCDIDARVVDHVNAAREPFPGETGLQEALGEVVPAGRLRATTDTIAAVADGADLVIAVPPLVVDVDGRPDFYVMDAVVADIGRGLKPGTVVCIETTLPVGTTRGRIAPQLAEASGLISEHDFFTIHSPERVYAGRIFRDLALLPEARRRAQPGRGAPGGRAVPLVPGGRGAADGQR